MSSIRRIAATAALALAASGLGVVAAQPATAAEGATFSWSFSDYLWRAVGPVGFPNHTAKDGATATDSAIEFGDGVGTGSLENGDLDVSYTGTVDFAWHVTISFSDPEIVVDGDEGRILADVSWAVPETGSADDVVLTTFDPATAVATGDSFTATPDWTSGSWAPELLAALPDSVDAFFKATGSNPTSDARKAPATFTATEPAAQAAPAVTPTAAYAGNAVTIDVAGTGFTAVTQPGDMGVYVVLAEAGRFPETDDFEDQDKVADAEWVTPAQMPDGSFTVTLDPANQHLDPRKDYAIYTWQAHSHSNPSQDTETPVAIDFSELGTKAALKARKKGKDLVVTVGDETAAGKVAVKYTKGTVSRKAAATVKNGVATLKLPAKPKGKWKAALTYTSTTAAYRDARKTVRVTV